MDIAGKVRKHKTHILEILFMLQKTKKHKCIENY